MNSQKTNQNLEIHLFSLSCKNIYISLEKEYRRHFFQKLLAHFKSECELARRIGVYNSTLNRWRRGKRMIPLEKINLFSKINKEPLEKIEKYIFEVQAGKNNNTGKSNGKIINPKFPIKFNKNIAASIGHILHDGSINKNRILYTNTYKPALQKFLHLLKTEIGLIKPCFHTSSFGGISIQIPKIISQIFIEGFDIQPGKKVEIDPEIPKAVKDCVDLNIIKEYIKAAFSDDGCVTKSNIQLGLSKCKDNKNVPPNLLLGMHELLKRFKIKPTRICLNRIYKTKKDEERESWYFHICGKENLKRFYEKIGFDSGLKQNKLKKLINKKGRFPWHCLFCFSFFCLFCFLYNH